MIKSFIPRAKQRRRPPQYDKREIINAIFYLVRSGCPWRMLPTNLPPWRLVYYYYANWRKQGVWDQIQNHLRDKLREKHGKKKVPVLRQSIARVLRQLPSQECADMMQAKRLWDANDISWLTRLV